MPPLSPKCSASPRARPPLGPPLSPGGPTDRGDTPRVGSAAVSWSGPPALLFRLPESPRHASLRHDRPDSGPARGREKGTLLNTGVLRQETTRTDRQETGLPPVSWSSHNGNQPCVCSVDGGSTPCAHNHRSRVELAVAGWSRRSGEMGTVPG